jgi:outer membrane lipoprotein SlyB
MNSNVYTENSTPGKVLEGKVINARAVTIKAHDKLQDNSTGGLIGGAGGAAAAGSAIGNGSGSVASAVGGAIVGAVAGAFVQDALSTQDGVEYLVKLDKEYEQEYDKINKKIQSKAGSPVEQDMVNTINVGSKTRIVSVVQAADAEIKVGSHVYVIYTDDRPHLVAESKTN